MKTQIIQLEPHDDTISVRDKLGWSQTGRVALVWPARGRLMDRHLDLVLLQRHSRSLGVQIALVTRDPEVRFQAGTLGIPVFQSVRKAQTERWKRDYRKSRSLKTEISAEQRLDRIQDLLAESPARRSQDAKLSQPVRITVFALAVLAVLSIAAVLVPKAEITLTPESREQAMSLNLQADDTAQDINLAGTLPARWAYVTVEGRSTTQTTGSLSIPSGYAAGEVVFENISDQPIIIPAGTVVSTPDSAHRFTTQHEARLPAGPGAEVSIEVQAVEPGSSSNLTRNRIAAVEGNLGVQVTVNNRDPISGGSLASSPAPTSDDRQRLRDDLSANLSQTALQEVKDNLAPADILLSQEPTLVRVISESYDPGDRQPASELELTLRSEFKIPYVSGEDIHNFGNSVLDANLPTDFSAVPGTLQVEQPSSPIFLDGRTSSWRLKFSRQIQSQPSTQQAVNLVLGHRPEKARQLLIENLSISGTPGIETSPSWWPVIPFVALRVEVISEESLHASNPDTSQVIQ